jgi:hypothetical protein
LFLLVKEVLLHHPFGGREGVMCVTQPHPESSQTPLAHLLAHASCLLSPASPITITIITTVTFLLFFLCARVQAILVHRARARVLLRDAVSVLLEQALEHIRTPRDGLRGSPHCGEHSPEHHTRQTVLCHIGSIQAIDTVNTHHPSLSLQHLWDCNTPHMRDAHAHA